MSKVFIQPVKTYSLLKLWNQCLLPFVSPDPAYTDTVEITHGMIMDATAGMHYTHQEPDKLIVIIVVACAYARFTQEARKRDFLSSAKEELRYFITFEPTFK